MNRESLPRICLAVTLATQVMAGSTGAFAAIGGGDGGPFNGPTLSPVSIPLQLDRGVSRRDAENAVAICFGTGDANQGVMSVMQRLSSAFFPGRSLPTDGLAQDFADDWATYGDTFAGPGTTVMESGRIVVGDATIGATLMHAISGEQMPLLFASEIWEDDSSQTTQLTGKLGVFHLTWSPGSGNSQALPLTMDPATSFFSHLFNLGAFVGESHWVGSTSLPEIAFDAMVDDSDYDAQGNLIVGRQLLTNPRIEFNSDLSTPLTFTDSTTGSTLGLALDLEGYAECLQNQIQLAVGADDSILPDPSISPQEAQQILQNITNAMKGGQP